MSDMTTASNWAPVTIPFAVRLSIVRNLMGGWNIKEAALACGIKPQSWREWELQGRKPRDFEQVCEQISEHTGCDRVWLMTGFIQPGLPDGPGDGLLLPRLDSNQEPADVLPQIDELPACA